MKNIFFLPVLLIQFITHAQSIDDFEGSHDHPLITRLPNYIIGEFEQNFDQEQIQISLENFQSVEGNKTYIYYYYNSNDNSKHPSLYQIVKNHEKALYKIGGKMIFHDGEGDASFMITRSHQKIWVKLHAANSGEVYYLTIMEETPMKEEITAHDILTSLNDQGVIALNINFELNKAQISRESMAIIEEIVKMLNENPSIIVSVEGHTDNTGDNSLNQSLSENRARNVVNAIISKGITPTRLSYKGWGSQKPLASNDTEAGRIKNRRVEIVKQ